MTPRIILITDPRFGDDEIARCVRLVGRALPPGWLCVQLRDKRRPLASLRVFASHLRWVTRTVKASLVINGDVRLARDVGADGVHLGRDAGAVADVRAVCGARVWVSVAAHSDEAVRVAREGRADAVLVSPVFPTRPPAFSEPPASRKVPRGAGALRSARAIGGERLAVYALGGITVENARACMAAGADGIAVIRALLASAEPARAARALRDALGG
jgi:thiamine-phosphate pyrophosphorylase